MPLGWQPFFQQQLRHDEWDTAQPVRVVQQHRAEVVVSDGVNDFKLPVMPSIPELVVGDWLLLDDQGRCSRRLERKTCFSRKSAGARIEKQLLSANVDTAFIVCSMNEDFNLNRIERYLSLVNESGASPVVILSKSDLACDPGAFIARVQALDPLLMVEALDARSAADAVRLAPWIKSGETIVVLGSSGVGKSTLVNCLCANSGQATGRIRESDDKGRHTTTARALISIDEGGVIIDTPGMREIQLAENKTGISRTFSDIEELAMQCRFSDCQHTNEPGCAVLGAVAAGRIEARRLTNYRKLLREEELNSASISQRRESDRAFGKMVKAAIGESSRFKGRS
ncbi:MAG: ribosome small subunit-dependent GTPase A [Pseudomonadota bacterium]